MNRGRLGGALCAALVALTACGGGDDGAGPGGTGGPGGAGTAGPSALVAVAVEPPGARCEAGGHVVRSGLDTNRNGVLDATEVTDTQVLCHPATASPWVVVSGTTQAMEPNKGYLATSSSLTTFTLPPNDRLAVGDVLRLHAAGTGGWTLNQQNGQRVVTDDRPGQPGRVWVKRDQPNPPNFSASRVAVSPDGLRIVAAPLGGGPLQVSTDAGQSWTATGPSDSWDTVAWARTGQYVVAAAFGRAIQVSADGGDTWQATGSGSRNWRGVAISGDGRLLIAGDYGTPDAPGQLYRSVDGGATWAAVRSPNRWVAVSMSADGTHVVAAAQGLSLLISNDRGDNWIGREAGRMWQDAAISDDGRYILAAAGDGLYLSTDGGQNFNVPSHAGSALNFVFNSVAMSADGSRMLAASSGRGVFVSTDHGATWTVYDDGTPNWNGVSVSADGYRYVAAAGGGSVYVRLDASSIGPTGGLGGGKFSALELEYVGGGTFRVLDMIGTITLR